ncbi:MAG: YciI family protein [Alphaproteobacteria bacterium]|nr:YciI family protein [Alphaproteobacteria bacterium]
MLFAIVAHDHPNSIDKRMALRPDHVEHLKAHADKLMVAGPMLDEAGEKPIGSLLIFDGADKAEVEAFCESDPYSKGGLFASVSIAPWKRVMVDAAIGAE